MIYHTATIRVSVLIELCLVAILCCYSLHGSPSAAATPYSIFAPLLMSSLDSCHCTVVPLHHGRLVCFVAVINHPCCCPNCDVITLPTAIAASPPPIWHHQPPSFHWLIVVSLLPRSAHCHFLSILYWGDRLQTNKLDQIQWGTHTRKQKWALRLKNEF